MGCVALDRPPFRWTLRCGLLQRCPCCGVGGLFAGVFRMRPACGTCGLNYFREAGYYVGAMIVNYGVTVAVLVTLYMISLTLPDFTALSSGTKIALWLGFTAGLSLSLVRPAYSLWLAFDYWLEPWEPGGSPPS